MELLVRLAVVWMAIGLAFGFVTRGQLKERFAYLPFMVGFLPVLVHIYLSYQQAITIPIESNQVFLFLGTSLILVALVFWVGWRSLKRQGQSLFLLPILLAVSYVLAPLTWLVSASEAFDLGMTAIPTLLFFGATLFSSSLLWSFNVTLPRLPKRKARTKTISSSKSV